MLFDTPAHYDDEAFAADRDALVGALVRERVGQRRDDRRDDRAGGVSCKVGAVAADLAPALDTLGFQADIHAVEMVNVAGRGVGERNFQRLRAGVDRNFFNLHLESLTSKIPG